MTDSFVEKSFLLPDLGEGLTAIRSVTTPSVSFDHCLVDGEQGSRFLADIAHTLATG